MTTKRKTKPADLKADDIKRGKLLEQKALSAFADASTERRAQQLLRDDLLPAYGEAVRGQPAMERQLLGLARVNARQDVLAELEEASERDGTQIYVTDQGERGEGVHPFQKLRKDLDASERAYCKALGVDRSKTDQQTQSRWQRQGFEQDRANDPFADPALQYPVPGKPGITTEELRQQQQAEDDEHLADDSQYQAKSFEA